MYVEDLIVSVFFGFGDLTIAFCLLNYITSYRHWEGLYVHCDFKWLVNVVHAVVKCIYCICDSVCLYLIFILCSSHSALSVRLGFCTSFLYQLNFLYADSLNRNFSKIRHKHPYYNTNVYFIFNLIKNLYCHKWGLNQGAFSYRLHLSEFQGNLLAR